MIRCVLLRRGHTNVVMTALPVGHISTHLSKKPDSNIGDAFLYELC